MSEKRPNESSHKIVTTKSSSVDGIGERYVEIHIIFIFIHHNGSTVLNHAMLVKLPPLYSIFPVTFAHLIGES